VKELLHQIKDLSELPVETLLPGDILLTNEQILQRIDELAEDVAKRYDGQKLTIIGLLKGAKPTVKHLIEALHKINFHSIEYVDMEVHSRDNKLATKGQIDIVQDVPTEMLVGKNILLVDDIADTLTTYAGVANHFFPNGYNENGIASFSTLSLLEKPILHDKELKKWVPLDFVGFKIPKVWVEGFGLDSFEFGRDNPNIVVGPTAGALAFNAAQIK